MKLWTLSFTLFLLMDSLGNIPLYLSFLKKIPPARQRFIIFREMVIALGVISLFMFLGDAIMDFLKISHGTLEVSGGIILFLISLKMIFPSNTDSQEKTPANMEPLIVPLAIPLIAGPAVLASIIIYSQTTTYPILLAAVGLAWLASLLILLASSFLRDLLGSRGLSAMEKLMGLILILIAVQMFLSGMKHFLATL
jgi:multiple antibiotic resistance protein